MNIMKQYFKLEFDLSTQMINSDELLLEIAIEIDRLHNETITNDVFEAIFTLVEHSSKLKYNDNNVLITSDTLTYTILNGTIMFILDKQLIDKKDHKNGTYANSITIDSEKAKSEDFEQISNIIDDVINKIKNKNKR